MPDILETSSWFRTNSVRVEIRYAKGGFIVEEVHNSRVNAGAAFIAGQVFNTSAAATPLSYIALSSIQVSPAAGDTTLSNEITTHGLGRAQAAVGSASTPGSLNGTTSLSLTNTFTYTGNTSQNIGGVGCFNANANGTLAFEAALANLYTVYSNGDSIAITWTFTF